MDHKCLLVILIYYAYFSMKAEGVFVRRKIARYQRFRSSGIKDANGYVIVEQTKFDKVLNTTRSILPSLQKNVDQWNSDSEALFESIKPLTKILLDGFKDKFMQTEKKYSDLFYAFYPEATASGDKSQLGAESHLVVEPKPVPKMMVVDIVN